MIIPQYDNIYLLSKNLKDDLLAGLTIGECFSYSDPHAHLVAERRVCQFLPYAGMARCLLTLVNKNVRISTKLLLTQYAVWLGELAKNENAHLDRLDPGFLQGMNTFLTYRVTGGLTPVSELDINARALPRLAPLAFYWAHYEDTLNKNIPYVYHVIYELSAISVGHRRAAVAAGLYIHVLAGLIKRRQELHRSLTRNEVVKVVRLRVTQTLMYYNSTFEYRGETGHFALLQTNNEGKLHLEGVRFEELKVSGYAVDTIIFALWLLLTEPLINKAMPLASGYQIAPLGAVVGSLFVLSYGNEKLTETTKKRFKSLLES